MPRDNAPMPTSHKKPVRPPLQKKGKQKKSTKHAKPLPAIPHPTYVAYFDGACGPVNPGGTVAYGAVIVQEGQYIWECSELFQPEPGKERATSNNLAEYCGLIAVLEHFIHMGAQHESIMVYGDADL